MIRLLEECRLAKPNYAFQKRQRELAKKQKKEEKRLRKAEHGAGGEAEDPALAPVETDDADEAQARPAEDDRSSS